MYSFLTGNVHQLFFQLLVSSWIFWTGMEKRDRYWIRLAGGIAVQYVVSYLWNSLITAIPSQSLLPYVALYMGYAVAAVIPAVFAYQVSLSEVVFVLTGTYAVQHMSFAVSCIIIFFIQGDDRWWGNSIYFFLSRYMIFIVGGLVIYQAFVKPYHKTKDYKNGDLRIGLLAILVMTMAIGVSVYWSYPTEYEGLAVTGVICPIYGFMICMLILWMCLNIFNENQIRQENQMMEQMLSIAKTQQKTSQEAIDIINIKCHDLKHQIRMLEKMENREDREEYVKEIQDAVSIYDAIYHTGCQSLDYVLREKSLIFTERSIDFDCMADGEAIDFMTPADIYSLMGNILDNALEAVLQEEEEERFISLQIRRQNEMALIHVENRCSKELSFREGLPVTTKEDRNYHGFGTRSIRFVAEKYDGSVRNALSDGVFTVDVLLPIEAKVS